MKNLLLLLIVILISGVINAQKTYRSTQQKTTTGGFTNRVETKVEKTVILTDTTFSLELPEGSTLEGTMSFWKTIEQEEQTRTLYMIDGGGLLSINDDQDDTYDHILVNLMATPLKKVYTYWFTIANRGDD